MFGHSSYCCIAWCGNNGRTCKKLGTKFFQVPHETTDSMEATAPPCGADPMKATAPSCSAASSFRPKGLSTAAHDSMEVTAPPCGADPMEATAPSFSSPLEFRPVTPSTWSSSEPVGACTSTPPLRSFASRQKGIIRLLQAKVSRYRKTIARLRKQEKNMLRSASEALDIICPHVTDDVLWCFTYCQAMLN
ncbi:uncharacterized protein ISCGN_011496 [Ixodes scapularis]